MQEYYHMIWQMEGRSSSLKTPWRELKQSSSARKNSNLKLKFMSWSISYSWQFSRRRLLKAAVDSFPFTNSPISMKHSFSSAFSNWSSM